MGRCLGWDRGGAQHPRHTLTLPDQPEVKCSPASGLPSCLGLSLPNLPLPRTPSWFAGIEV